MDLKTLRKNTLINMFGRWMIFSVARINNTFALKLSYYWRVSGLFKLNILTYSITMFCKGDDGIVDDYYYKRYYKEDVDLMLFDKLVKKSDVIFDIGANTGLYSMVASKGSPTSKIFAFEPNPVNLERLNLNIKINNLHNISVIDKAAGDLNSRITFTVPADDSVNDSSSADGSFSRSLYEGEITWKDISVDQIRIDDFFLATGLQKVDLIKIDVENYEAQAFSGMENIIRTYRPEIICELFFRNSNQIYFQNLTSESGYHVYKITKQGLIKTDFSNILEGLNYYFSKYEYGEFFSSSQIAVMSSDI